MPAQSTVRVAVTGAAGQIGYALLFRIASGQMFGPHTRVRLQLLELEAALPALRGVAMELEDCAFPLLEDVLCTADPKEAFGGANWCLLVGSVPRKKGMERAELLGINGKIFTVQGQAIGAHAAADVRVFVVGNPCNTNCLIAMHNAKGVPQDRFFAMTALDENRARAQLARRAGVALTAVTRLAVWGNHSAKQFPDFFNARIAGKPAVEVIGDTAWLKETFLPMIQQRGAAVIEARGSSSAASAANAVVDGVRRLREETPAGDCISMSMASEGQYEVDKGLIFSYPARLHGGRLEVVTDFDMEPYARDKIAAVLQELREEAQAVHDLKLI